MPRLIFAFAALVMALSACGTTSSSSTKFTGDKKVIADAVAELQKAGERKDAGKICKEILAADLVAAIERDGSSCTKEVKAAIDDADDFSLKVQDVTINGTTADVKVKGKAGKKDRLATFQFRKENGKWRATSLSPGG